MNGERTGDSIKEAIRNKNGRPSDEVTFRFASTIDLSAHFFIKDKQANMNLKI